MCIAEKENLIYAWKMFSVMETLHYMLTGCQKHPLPSSYDNIWIIIIQLQND